MSSITLLKIILNMCLALAQKASFFLLFILFLVLFICLNALFCTIHGSPCTISATF